MAATAANASRRAPATAGHQDRASCSDVRGSGRCGGASGASARAITRPRPSATATRAVAVARSIPATSLSSDPEPAMFRGSLRLRAMPNEPQTESESIVGLKSLVAQLTDPSLAAVARIAATNAARSYLEAITRNLVEEARKQGATWREIADLFVTSEMNVKARFGDLHDYGDDEDDEDG